VALRAIPPRKALTSRPAETEQLTTLARAYERKFSKSTVTETVTQLQIDLKGIFHKSQAFFNWK
jgi:hypothetical protein